MKIALVKNHCSLHRGGSERYCVNLARGLISLGHAVTVIGLTIDEELCDELSFVPVRVRRGTSWHRNTSFARQCGAAAVAGDFDVVYGLGRAFGLDAVRVTERLQGHWVRVGYRGPARYWQRWNPRHRALIALESAIYGDPLVRRVVVQSSVDAGLVGELYGVSDAKLRTIPNGVDLSVFHPGAGRSGERVRGELGLAGGDPLLVFASMDFAGKGLRTVLAAMAACRGPDWRLVVLGSGPRRRFARLAVRYGVDRRVIFAGRREEIAGYYGAGDLFVLPSVYEPFPNVILEAMACGLPVVTTRTAGGVDLVEPGRTGFLLDDPRDAAGLAACLDSYRQLTVPERRGFSTASAAKAATMSFAATVAATESMLGEVCGEKRAAGPGRRVA